MLIEHSSLRVALPGSVLHGELHGELQTPRDARGIVVPIRLCSADTPGGESADAILHQAGFATLSIDLLSEEECHFPAARADLPRLVKRLLAVVAHLRRRREEGALPALPCGLIARNETSPVALRVAALRDREIGALVCQGGLIDLAGRQYLRSLQSPLLMLTDTAQEAAVAASTRRALSEIPAHCEMREIAADDGMALARSAAGWFTLFLTRPASEVRAE